MIRPVESSAMSKTNYTLSLPGALAVLCLFIFFSGSLSAEEPRERSKSGDSPDSGVAAAKRWEELTRAEQERLLHAYERWKDLPEDEQERIRENLEVWRTLSASEKDRLREAKTKFDTLSPERKKMVLRNWARWRGLSEDRRRILKRIWGRISQFPSPVRHRLMNGIRNWDNLTPVQKRRFMRVWKAGPDAKRHE